MQMASSGWMMKKIVIMPPQSILSSPVVKEIIFLFNFSIEKLGRGNDEYFEYKLKSILIENASASRMIE